MEYAIIRSGNKQYKVCKGDVIEVDKLFAEKDAGVNIDDVLLWVSDKEVKIGKPKLLGIKVKAKVLEQKKGEKIRVAKFHAKVRYRRAMGFRSYLTKLQIEEIETNRSEKKTKEEVVVLKKTTRQIQTQ